MIEAVGSATVTSISTSPVKVAAGEVGGEHETVGVGPDAGRAAGTRGASSAVSSSAASFVSVLMVGRLPSRPCRMTPDPAISLASPAIQRCHRRRRAAPKLDVVAIGNALVDVLASASDDDLRGARPGQGNHGAGRPRPLGVHLRGHGPDHRGLGGFGGQHRGRGWPRSGGRVGVPRTGGRRRAGSGLHPRHPIHRRGLRPGPHPGRPRRGGDRPLPGPGDRRRRTDHGHPPRGGVRLRARRPPRRPSVVGPGGVPRGLPVGAAVGQGGHARGHRGGPRQRRLGGPVRVGSVLRRAPPGGVPRAARRRPRAALRQRGGDHVAVRRLRPSTPPWRRWPTPACWPC